MTPSSSPLHIYFLRYTLHISNVKPLGLTGISSPPNTMNHQSVIILRVVCLLNLFESRQ
ncbi:hypothetical protein BDZ89DRAFT_1076252 [Hymenopellis radicata]|nr:hypothetical protein BDZ89DRAFT_1076240 [Hymenopellis radicata]KAF9014863.1 hypothetical protein BDZ89DRAFT_1076252 [Hymenopellis radicata]